MQSRHGIEPRDCDRSAGLRPGVFPNHVQQPAGSEIGAPVWKAPCFELNLLKTPGFLRARRTLVLSTISKAAEVRRTPGRWRVIRTI